MQRKIALGPWFAPVFRVLYAMRRLRGTRFDLFGYAHVRRAERALVAEYEGVISELLPGLAPATLAKAVEIAGLPDLVRGYEQIKLDSVETYRRRLDELRVSAR